MTGQALCDALFRDPAAPESGNGIVQVAAFLDYRCPYCRTLSKILSALHAEKDVRLVHKEWPILGRDSELAARAALAAGRQGQYAPFHARLMETRLIPTQSLIESFAAEMNLDVARLRADMVAEDISAALARNGALAGQFGFIGTPALVVGRTVVQGEITRDQLERLIDEEAAERTLPPC
jgi:protein-disulfide isomerase